mmetsp:Transcript_34280/g.53473  ORF Transcript_34280/g.53473 Transcript_34280/m.53473 type:complete len:121 (-) Transcript_34280:234-596(-)
MKGLGAGGEAGKLRLWVDGELDDVTWRSGEVSCGTYEGGGDKWVPETCKIAVAEVFGCGGAEADQAQEEYRMREQKYAERARKVDRAQMFGGREGWNENPDKFILDIAGVTGTGNDFLDG